MEDTREIAGKIIGINTRCYPSPSTDYVEVRVVLVAAAIGYYAAYAGAGRAEWVKHHGSKISFAEACEHFPGGQLEEERYRL